VFVAMYVLAWRHGRDRGLVDRVVDGALGPICAIVLITGAGGMFGGVLRATGIGGAIAESLESLGLPLIVAGFVIAAIVRMAQGSATVALTTAAALVQPAVQAATDLNAGQLAAMVLALAAAGQGRPAHLVGRVPSGYRKAPGVITLAAPSQDEARSVLAELLDLHAIGRTTFLPLPVKTSQAYADLARRTRPEIALAKAEREWVGSRDVPGEVADAYHRLVLGPDAPIADLVERGFEQHAATLWFPLLDRMEVDA
jgi:exonuclease V gamma subunit